MKTKFYFNLKSWLLMMLMLIGAGGNLWAEDVTVTFASNVDVGTGTSASGSNSISKDGITITCTSGGFAISGGANYRLGANSTTTISSSVGNIKSVLITGPTGTGNYSISRFDGGTGWSISNSAGTATWNGDAVSVSIKANAQVRPTKFEVTYTPSGNVPIVDTPTFSPAEGAVAGGTEVTISCTTDGATIYYTTDGSTPSTNSYSGSSVIINEDQTIKAYAVKNGYTDSEVATATYTVKQAIGGYAIDFENDVEYTDWIFNNVGRSTGDISAHGGSYYGSNINDAGNGVSTAFLQTRNKIVNPGTFTCYLSKTTNNTTASSWTLQVSSDGNTWTDVKSQSAVSMSKGEWIEFTKDLSRYSDVYVRLYYDGTNAERAVDDITLTLKNTSLQDVTLQFPETAYSATMGSPFSAPTATASPEVSGITYSSSNEAVATVNETTGAVTLVAAGTTVITATFEGNDTYNGTSASYTLNVARDPNGPGTQNNPYTVAQALEADVESGVYVKGIVSAVTEVSTQYGNVTYKISDDGETSSDQFIVFRGKNVNNQAITSDEDVQVGDVVVVYGNIAEYQGANQLAQGNYLVSLTRPEKPEAGLAYATTEITAERGGVFTAPELTNPNNLNVTYSSSNEAVATVDAETGVVTLLKAGETTITATFDGNSDYKPGSASYSLTVTVPSHTATFFVNGQQTGEGLLVAEDAAITFPATPEAIEGKTFVGWVTEAIDGETDEAPNFVTSATMGTADVTYYAVFASQEGSGDPTWTETALSALTASDIFVIVGNGYAMTNDKGTVSAPAPVTITVDDSNLTSTVTDNIKWNVSGNATEGYTFYPNGDDKKWLYCNTTAASSSNNNMRVGTGDRKVFELDTNGYLVTKDTYTTRYLSLYNDQDFRGYVTTSNGAFVPAFYKYSSNISYSGYCTTVIKPVAKIGNKGFATLQEAVDAAEAGQTIDIVDDFTLTTVTTSPNDKYNVNVNKSVTINGNGHVITSAQGKRALALTGEGNKITIKSLTIVNNKADWCMGILNNLTCTLDATTIDGTGYAGSYNQPLTIGSIDGEGRVTLNVTNGSVVKTNDEGTAHYSIIVAHPADITVTDSELIGWATVYLKPDAAGSTVKIEGSEMKSQGLSGNSNNFSILVTEGGNNTIEVKDTKITSSAVEGTYQSLITLGGEGNVVKLLGETTYETNDKTWGAITYNWGSLMNNKLYLDDTTKAAFAEYLDGSHQETIDPADETGLYPVSFEPEVLYYWAVGDSYQGGYYSFADPFKNGWLDNGEFIALQKDITLTEDITCQLASGTSFNFLLSEFAADKNGHSVSLNTGVTVYTDKQTDIFSAAEAGYMIEEAKVEAGFTYTAVKVEVAAPIVFHDGGTYEEALTVPMIAQAGAEIYYSTDGESFTKYTQPLEISATTTVTAYATMLGAESDKVEKTFTIVAKQAGPTVEDGYYNIKTNGNKFVNVAGRKTVTLVDNTEGMPGTVIRVKATDGKVETLRSQGVDVPGYAQKAMNYVPEIVRLAVDKLHAVGAGELLGEHGMDAIMTKFNESFDYNLYLEKVGETEAYRIYGRTPSMKPVVDFYAENKDNVDAKLPQLEQFINQAIDKVLEKTGGRGAGILVDFDLETVWENMGGTLTKPVDETSTAKFYEEVLTSEANVWNFAYQTAMIYWGNLKNNDTFKNNLDKLGDYAKYIDKVENIQPNFKYYIVPSESGVDFISEGNIAITDNDPAVAWTLNECTEFNVNFDVVQNHTVYSTNGGVLAEYSERYTTLYTDFAYTLPDGVKAYKVKSISDKGVAVREEITGTIPAQTPVMLINTDNANSTKALVLSTDDGTPVTGNLLVGADELINQYQLKTSQVESLFNMAKDVLGETAYNEYLSKYEHLMLTNAGTVNNKYFFGLSAEDVEKCVVKNENNEEDCVIRSLSTGDEKVGFYDNWTAGANQAFLISSLNPVKLWLVGDVNRDGSISIADVTALVNIILGKAIYPEDADEYDFEAANVNGDNIISIADVTKLVNMILGKE